MLAVYEVELRVIHRAYDELRKLLVKDEWGSYDLGAVADIVAQHGDALLPETAEAVSDYWHASFFSKDGVYRPSDADRIRLLKAFIDDLLLHIERLRNTCKGERG